MSTGFASAGFDAVGYASGSFQADDHAIEAAAHAAFSFQHYETDRDGTDRPEAGA